jgi:hypothetical protein
VFYPDSLLAQVLMASTYPLEIVQAARWAGTNSKLKGKALEDALQPQPWDPSVKSIVVVPQVLQMLNDKLDWTEMLGNAFLAQQDDLLKAVQDLRARADAKGTLKTTSQQKVSKQSVAATSEPGAAGGGTTNAIVIQIRRSQVMYVPTYDPGVVYGAWPIELSALFLVSPGYVAGNLVRSGSVWRSGRRYGAITIGQGPSRRQREQLQFVQSNEYRQWKLAAQRGPSQGRALRQFQRCGRFGQKARGGVRRAINFGRTEAGS